MIKPSANKYSWYPINNHYWVASPRLTEIDCGSGVFIRYDLKKGKPIVVLSKKKEFDPKAKLKKIDLLKYVLSDISVTTEKQLAEEVSKVNNIIVKIVNNE